MFGTISTVIFFCIIAGVIWLVVRSIRGHSEFKSVITKFMEAGVARDMGAAYACFSPQSGTKEEIAEFIERSYDVFAGYERLSINKSAEDTAGITEAYVSGAISYTGGKELPFKASLVKENGVWKITGIHIGSTARGTVKIISVD